MIPCTTSGRIYPKGRTPPVVEIACPHCAAVLARWDGSRYNSRARITHLVIEPTPQGMLLRRIVVLCPACKEPLEIDA